MPREFKVFLLSCPGTGTTADTAVAPDSEVAEQYLRLLRRDNEPENREGITVAPLPCPFEGFELFIGSGWYMGGHMFHRGAALARSGGTNAVIGPVKESPPYDKAVAFQGNTVSQPERKRSRPDLDLTPAIVSYLASARDSKTLDEAALLELTNLLVVIYHAQPNVYLQIPLGDTKPSQMRQMAEQRHWTLIESEYSPGGWDEMLRPANDTATAPAYPHYSFAVSGRGVRLTCAAVCNFGGHTDLEAITLESDYSTVSLTSKTVHYRDNMIH